MTPPEFDPYRELLNIDSPDRPPNHYDMLGLSLFESDRQKIDDAAGQRMAMLQELANSEHMDASQQLLNEVSAARRCLLNDTQKIAYDEDIRTRQRRSQANSARSAGSRRGKQAKRSKPVLPVGIALVVVIALAAFWLVNRGGIAPGNLIVEWPRSERQGAAILLDGEPLSVPDTDPISLNIPTGRHTLTFQRSGFNDIPKTITFARARVRTKLNWVPQNP